LHHWPVAFTKAGVKKPHLEPSHPQAPVQPPAPALPAGLRRYLYFTAAATGAAILIVEILGAKMLAPYFGTSHFVWTAQIGVTLVALAAGYYLGGILADKTPGVGRMYACILAAAVYLCLTVPVCRPLAYACLDLRLALGSLAAAAVLFFPPLTLLAAVGPFVVRNLTQSVASVGSQMGRLSAISTLGSVLGTVLIGYVMIPFLPNSVTMLLTGALLMLVAAGYFWIIRRNQTSRAGSAVILLAALGGLAGGYAGLRAETRLAIPGFEELERRNSLFGELLVIQHTNQLRRYYLNDYLTQNTYDPAEKKSLSMFTYMLHDLAVAYTPRIEHALCIGLGVGIVPMNFAREGVKVDVVEINPAVVGIARRHFNLEPEKLNIIIDDGRHYLNRCQKQYDAILLDAFLGDSSPSHLMTREAFAAMQRLLRTNGTLVINSFGDLDPGRNFFAGSLEKTLKSVFKSVRAHISHYGGNLMLVASDRVPLEMKPPADFEHVHPDARMQTEMAFANVVETPQHAGRVLTDDYNPVEYYDAANRERMRRQLAIAMRPRTQTSSYDFEE